MSYRTRFATWVAEKIAGETLAQLAVRVRIDDSSDGWSQIGRYPHDRTLPEIQKFYEDALKAWRKNPLAWNTIRITTNYVLGDGISITSPDPNLQAFIEAFWDHPENRFENWLEPMCDELSRAGDLFPVLFRNHYDGMSYVRFLTKDQVMDIQTKPNDWATEIVVVQKPTLAGEGAKSWYTPKNGRSRRTQAVILHHSVNRPLGALMGESDLASVLPWLLKYSQMVEDRVRLHWAVRAFLWIVTVPAGRVKAKREQYAEAPESGSIVVTDEGEKWTAVTPNLHATDASHDLKSVRNMVDAGTGYPPHWRGESADVNLATAEAMQQPVERHLKRRQKYFAFVIQDIIYQAYQRAHLHLPDQYPALPSASYRKLFTVATTDISSTDNLRLAQATKEMTAAFKELAVEFPNSSKLRGLWLRLALKFAGEQPDGEFIEQVLQEAGKSGAASAVLPPISTVGKNGRSKEMA